MSLTRKVEKVYENTNLVQNQTYIYVARKVDARQIMVDWKNKDLIHFSKYKIKETDMRQKTATFSSPHYFDLTTGQYVVLITSPYHEDFGGIILSVEYDEDTGMYDYQCQDWSRNYQGRFQLINGTKGYRFYNILIWLITMGGVPLKKANSKSRSGKYKKVLSGLRPKLYYDQGVWENGIKFNPMDFKNPMVIKDKTWIETIRDLIYGTGAYVDIYFDKYGVLQIKPFSRDDWLSGGLYLTTKELASRKFKFDTTNIITGVEVNAEDTLKIGHGYTSKTLTGLDLAVFFGNLTTSISNPNKTSTKTVTKKVSVKDNGKEGKGITVFMNIDNIMNKSADKKLMKDIAKLLRKRGYKTEIGGIGPSYHYSEINKVKKNGIYFTIYGGKCAGTLKEQCYSNHFWNVLNKRKAKMVVGFQGTKLKDGFLHRAHDDNFSPASFTGWNNPRSNLLKKGIGIAEGNNAKEIASHFPGFSTKNTKKTTKTKTVKKTVKNTIPAWNYVALEKASAKEKIVDSIRDLLTLKITIPLGNPVLKDVHTNMFLWTELPSEFQLANLLPISQALNSTYSRYSGYTLDRWYIESVDISNDNGKFTMDLGLNPFASTLVKYKEDYKKFMENYTNAVNKNNTSSSKKTKKSSKSGNDTLKGGEGKTIDNLVKKIVGNETNELKKAKKIHDWLKSNVRYKRYDCTKYNTPVKCLNNKGHLNCADTARLTRSMMASAGLKCYVVHRTYNGGHFWTIIEINGKKYASDQTGSGSAWNTVWKRSGRTKVSNGGDYSRKNGKNPDC